MADFIPRVVQPAGEWTTVHTISLAVAAVLALILWRLSK